MWRHQKSRSVCVKQALNTRLRLVNTLVTWHVSYKITTLIISWAWNCLIVHVWQGLVLPSANYFWKIPRTAQNASKNDVALPSLRSQDDSSFTFLWVKLLTDFFPPVSSTQQRRHIHTQPTTKHWCILIHFWSGSIFNLLVCMFWSRYSLIFMRPIYYFDTWAIIWHGIACWFMVFPPVFPSSCLLWS